MYIFNKKCVDYEQLINVSIMWWFDIRYDMIWYDMIYGIISYPLLVHAIWENMNSLGSYHKRLKAECDMNPNH